MATFILIVLFYSIYTLVLFISAYSNDTADIAHSDFERTHTPSLIDLSEEDRNDYCIVDDYIKYTICPSYHHQILKGEIDYYQKDSYDFLSNLYVNILFSMISLEVFDVEKWRTFYFFVALVIGYICYYIVTLLYKKYSTIRIKDYYEIYTSYDWHNHYRYLLSIEKNVIFRHMLRKIVAALNFIGCWLVMLVYTCVINL